MERHRLVACVEEELTGGKTAETSSTPDPVISSTSVLKPEPLSECPDENLMSRTYQPDMDFRTTQQGIKEEFGMFESPDTVVGYQSWQESKLPENVSLKEELIVLSGETEDQQVPTPQPNLQQPGDEIKCEGMKLESTRSEDPSEWYIRIPGKLEKEIVDFAEMREGNSRLLAQKPPVPVALYRQNAKRALYRHIAKRMATVKNDKNENLKSLGQKQIILSCSPGMSSYVTSVDNVTHHGDGRNEGSLCGRKSVIKSILEQKSPYIRENRLKCTVCEYRCTNSNSLAVHMETHNSDKKFRCSVCDHMYSSKGSLTTHMRAHTGEKPFMCTVCDYRSTNSGALIVHKRIHSGEKPYKCDFCGFRCNNNSGLTTHMRTHTGEKPYMCTICDYRSADNRELVVHMRRHTGEKPYKCNLCGFRSIRKSGLTAHLRQHTDAKPFGCSLCSYSCTSNRSLTAHMTAHSGDKPFKCSLCDYSSKTKECVVEHMATHNEEKPFACTEDHLFINI